jgi:hypothetical protein
MRYPFDVTVNDACARVTLDEDGAVVFTYDDGRVTRAKGKYGGRTLTCTGCRHRGYANKEWSIVGREVLCPTCAG